MEIVLIEGEPGTAAFLARGLAAEGFRTTTADDGRTGVELALATDVDAVVLDLGPDEAEALNELRVLHSERPELPVILLSRHTDLPTKIRCFELGASDVLEKPFSFEELVARMRAHVRAHHAHRDRPGIVHSGSLTLDLARHEARLGGRSIVLTARETRLLALLCEHCGEVVSRERLLSEVWGYYFDPRSNVVDVCVGRLRKKLGPKAPIETVRRAGYRLSSGLAATQRA
ncbi:MAG TPA: response regulator transcription factor [Gaiellaceae bacterium]|nr:response regulator transcription factor [Gaiellaceae bacterium]